MPKLNNSNIICQYWTKLLAHSLRNAMFFLLSSQIHIMKEGHEAKKPPHPYMNAHVSIWCYSFYHKNIESSAQLFPTHWSKISIIFYSIWAALWLDPGESLPCHQPYELLRAQLDIAAQRTNQNFVGLFPNSLKPASHQLQCEAKQKEEAP